MHNNFPPTPRADCHLNEIISVFNTWSGERVAKEETVPPIITQGSHQAAGHVTQISLRGESSDIRREFPRGTWPFRGLSVRQKVLPSRYPPLSHLTVSPLQSGFLTLCFCPDRSHCSVSAGIVQSPQSKPRLWGVIAPSCSQSLLLHVGREKKQTNWSTHPHCPELRGGDSR